MKIGARQCAAALAGTLIIVMAVAIQQAAAHEKAKCKQVAQLQIDPIVARGSVQSAHLHTFLGAHIQNTPDRTRAGWAELQNVATTCAPSGDKAAYWVPALIHNGKVLNASTMIGYYGCFQSANVDQCGSSNQVQAYPRDLRMVAGNSNATAPQSTDVIGWVCRTSSGPVGPFSSPSEANCETRVPSNKGLTVHVDFPTCWDGVLADHTVDGNTADADGPGPQVDHVVYPNGYPSKSATCPSSHPRKLSHLRLNINWRCGASGTWACESDNITLASGSQFTMHGDFLNGWTDAGMAGLLACINTTASHPHGSSSCG